MTDAEFADTPTDRATLAAILTAAGEARAASDDLTEMNGLWDRLTGGLANADDGKFDDWRRALIRLVMLESPAVRQRAESVVSHLIGWRAGDLA